MKIEIKNIDSTSVFIIAIIAFIVIMSATTISVVYFVNSVKNIQYKNQIIIENNLKNLEIKSDRQTYKVTINPKASKYINTFSDDNYKNFLIKYNENQSNWLNSWLTGLTILLAFIGLVAPLCFMKLYDDKKKQMDEIIKEAKIQKDKSKLNVKTMEKQLKIVDEKAKQTSNDLKEVKNYMNEIKIKSTKMSEDLLEVKQYVKEAKALSKFNEAISLIGNQKVDEAKNKIREAYELNNSDDKILELYAIYILFEEKDYIKAIEFLDKCISINSENYSYYYNKSHALYELKQYENAIKILEIANEKTSQDIYKSYIFSKASNMYAKLGNKEKVYEYINKALNLYVNSTVLQNCAISAILIQDYKKMIELINRMIITDIHPKASNYYNLTEAYIMLKQYTDALKTIKKYAEYQKQDECFGIYYDDYDKWMSAITEKNDNTLELINIIDSLEKRQRDDEL